MTQTAGLYFSEVQNQLINMTLMVMVQEPVKAHPLFIHSRNMTITYLMNNRFYVTTESTGKAMLRRISSHKFPILTPTLEDIKIQLRMVSKEMERLEVAF
jgi:hypothetical protein